MRSHPFRSTLILFTVAVGTALAAVGGWRYARASAPVSGPIVVISVDSLRADHLPPYGYRKVKTPAIDRLAADGIVFDRAYSHATQTLPAHVAMLSGRFPFESGVRDDLGPGVRPGERLLAEMLRERGYSTAGVVSAYVLRKDTGIGQGFDFFDGELPPPPVDFLARSVGRDGSESEQIAERWLAGVGTSRAFLFLHLYEPSGSPVRPDRFRDDSPYDARIAYSDEVIGRLVQYLKSHQLYDRSTIFLTSDHGEGLGDHGETGHGLFIYDETLRVPLIVKPESNAGAGSRVPDPVQLIDLAPTILDLAKAPIPGSLRGQSLKPLLERSGRLPERAIYSESLYGKHQFGWSELTAMTKGPSRLIQGAGAELYDLRRDPGERRNVAADRTDEVRSMQGALRALVTPAPPRATPISTDARERLESLGYIAPDVDPLIASQGVALVEPNDMRAVVAAYRRAVDFAAGRRWGQALALFQQLVRTHPEMPGVWNDLAVLAEAVDRHDLAIDAYRHLARLKPADPSPYLGLSSVLLMLKRLDDARQHAELAAALVPEGDTATRRTAHETLMRIALAAHDRDAARRQSELILQLDARVPIGAYVEGRLLYDRGQYADALPFFEQALTSLKKAEGVQLSELHFYAADTFVRLERYQEAEVEFLDELRVFPRNSRARVGLATLYQTTNRGDAAARVIADMLGTVPTANTYTLASRFWRSLGNVAQANAVRAESKRLFKFN